MGCRTRLDATDNPLTCLADLSYPVTACFRSDSVKLRTRHDYLHSQSDRLGYSDSV